MKGNLITTNLKDPNNDSDNYTKKDIFIMAFTPDGLGLDSDDGKKGGKPGCTCPKCTAYMNYAETLIKEHKTCFLSVGRTLQIIKEQKLYLTSHDTFCDYFMDLFMDPGVKPKPHKRNVQNATTNKPIIQRAQEQRPPVKGSSNMYNDALKAAMNYLKKHRN